MMRLFVIFGLVMVFAVPAFAQSDVTGFSKSSLQKSNTTLAERNADVLAGDIRERIENGIVLKSGRRYVLSKDTVIETIDIEGASNIEAVFDFENEILFVRTSGNNGFHPIAFSELAKNRARTILDYGCFIGGSSRASEAAYFVEKFCR